MATAEQLAQIVAKLQHLESEQVTMKDLFNRAIRATSGGAGGSKLNYREAERRMAKEFNGKGSGYAEYVFKMKHT